MQVMQLKHNAGVTNLTAATAFDNTPANETSNCPMQRAWAPRPWPPALHIGGQKMVDVARSIYRNTLGVSAGAPAKRFAFKAGLPFDEIRFPGLSGDNP